MAYYLQDNPNPNTGQYGWPRRKVSGVIGVHTAENNTDFEGVDPGAEDVARFIGRRSDYGSYHAIADADSRLKLVHPSYAAWADTTNNVHAMSISGAMQAARWRELSPARAAALTRNMAIAAAELVRDAIAAGLLGTPTPARRITPAEAVSGSRAGFYGLGETNPGTRYDPGQNFDWALFLTTYDNAVHGSTTPIQEDDLTPEQAQQLAYISSAQFKADIFAGRSEVERNARADFHLEGLNTDVPWFAFDGKIPTEGRKTTTLATATGYADTIAGGLSGQNIALRELVDQLAIKQGVVIDYDLIAKKVNDDAAKRLAK